MKEHFLLKPGVHYLNHGSFGACPIMVFNDYQRWQLELEKEPFQFTTKHAPALLKKSREALGEYLGCSGQDLFFTPNPTTAVNTIMRSMHLNVGDEILTTNLEYGAMDKTWKFYCRKTGAKYIQQTIDLPITSKAAFLEQFWSGLSDRTKVVFISQITSSTALILPVQEIVDKAKALGLMTIVDGAHVPGHIDLNIHELGTDYYVGAVHKWLMSPKGCSFLHVRKELQNDLDPLIISWGYDAEHPGESQFLDYHEYNGTRDFAPYLTVPALLEFRKHYNWEEEIQKCKQQILEWYPTFCELLNTTPICPVSDEFLGQMFSVPIKTSDEIALKETLYNRFNIEIPVTKHGSSNWIRLSLQPYNTKEEIQALYNALDTLKQEGDLLLV